jgi:hypothetical protein
MAQSSPVVDDTNINAAQYNKLREDVLEVHCHDQVNLVEHGFLTEVTGFPIPGTYLTHAILNQHVQGEGMSTEPDNPGGEAGVHGLPFDAFILGTRQGAGIEFVIGRNITNAFNDGCQYCIPRISFGVVFTEPPKMIVCAWEVHDNRACAVSVDSVSEYDFQIRLLVTNYNEELATYFNWLAIGVTT